jgi:hypothetical protein
MTIGGFVNPNSLLDESARGAGTARAGTKSGLHYVAGNHQKML